MKSSAFVLCVFLGLAQASQYEVTDLQIDSEAQNRQQIRATLQNQIRDAQAQWKDPRMENWKFPGNILPASSAYTYPPPPSDPTELQLESQSSIRATLQDQLRAALPAHPFDEEYLQINDEDDTVEGARKMAAQMQAQMDASVAAADQKRAEQQTQFENNVNKNDPAAQLQGLMNAQSSLKRMTSAFSAKPNSEKVEGMAKKLGIPMTPELMQLGNNEAISNALVEIAVGMGKTEAEISASLD